MDFLDGHPLAMRVMLTQLADHSAAELLERLRHRLPQAAEDDAQAKLFATLGFVEEALPEALKPLLVPLVLHERFVDADYLEAMAGTADASHSRTVIDQMLTSLETLACCMRMARASTRSTRRLPAFYVRVRS